MTTPRKEQMMLNFRDKDIQLFNLLRQQAAKNRRTLTAEILYRIEQTLVNQINGDIIMETTTRQTALTTLELGSRIETLSNKTAFLASAAQLIIQEAWLMEEEYNDKISKGVFCAFADLEQELRQLSATVLSATSNIINNHQEV